MLWIKIAFSTTSLETFNVCFEKEEAIVRFTNFMMGSALGIMGKSLALPSVLYVNTKRSHGQLHDPIARSRVFPFSKHTRDSSEQTSSHVQRKHRHRDTKVHLIIMNPNMTVEHFPPCICLAFELSPFTRVKRERKKKRKRWRDAWRLSCPATYPQQGQTILRIVLLLGLLSFGILSLLVQKRDFSAKFKAKIRSYILSQSTIINSLLS